MRAETSSSVTDQPDIDLYVAKLTTDGDFAWQRGFGNALQQQDAFDLAVTSEGGVVLDATTKSSHDIAQFHIDADTSGSGFLLKLDGSGDPSFVTSLNDAIYLEAHNAVVIGDCRDFYAAAQFQGSLFVPRATGSGDIFVIAGRY